MKIQFGKYKGSEISAPPPEFLQRLASQCGGSFDPHVEFDKLYGAKALESKIKGLLPAPSEEKPGAICL